MNPAESFLQSILVALSAIGLVVILRNAPVIRGWVQEAKKPWACNVCLPLYVCAALVGGLYWLLRDLHVLLTYLPSYALSYLVLEKLSARPDGPPNIPSEFEQQLDESL
jgi:hypothetical protein